MIEINNLTTNPVDEEFLKKIAKITLTGEEKKKAELSIAIIGAGRMRELNKKYQGKNRVTDVLSFGENEIPNSKFRIPKSIRGFGEIVICLREVKKNAKRYKSTFETELARVLIHGILHLLGYDHDGGEKESKKMEEKQEHYLSQVKF
jgi:probable rRNA maturation factor